MKRIALPTLLILLFCAFDPAPLWEKRLDEAVAKELPKLTELYKSLHQSPELSLFESETAKRMAQELRDLGFDVTEKVGGHGVVGVFKNGEGPTVLLRTDLDALPIREKTALEYASSGKTTNEEGLEVGLMHACGHDMHMTVWTGTARMLTQLKDTWKGTVVMIGQPAEEIGAGARMMLEDGLFERFPVPDYGLALHCSPTLTAGKVGFCPGFSMANAESIDIKVFGEGGHGAAPHTTIDPVVLASMIVMDLQTIVSRNIKPTDAAVITVGAINGGSKHNVIPEEVSLKLTLRSYKQEVRQQMIAGIRRICNGAAMAMGLPKEKYPEVIVPEVYTPANYNDPKLTEQLKASAAKVIGEENVSEAEPQMVGEDFARYGKTEHKIPTVLYWLGTVGEERFQLSQEKGEKLPGLHSPYYFPEPETSIVTGVKVMTTCVIDLMNNN